MEPYGKLDRHRGPQRERLAQSLEPGARIEPWEDSDEEGEGGALRPVNGNASMRDLETIHERPADGQLADQPGEAEFVGSYDLLESYSKEMVLSSFPVLDSDVFPPLRVKTHGARHHARVQKQPRQQTSQKIVRFSPPRMTRLGSSPYDIEWSQRILERHFHVYFRSEREVCRIGRSSVERQRKTRQR